MEHEHRDTADTSVTLARTGLAAGLDPEAAGDRSTALGKGLVLLWHMAQAADAGETLGVSALARRTGHARSTTHRLLAVLRQFGLVEQRADGSYELGLGLFELGSRVPRREALRELSMPHLEALRDATGETAHLGALMDDTIVYLEKVESRSSVRMTSQVGHRSPLHCTALGKAMLAFGDPRFREAFLAGAPFPRRTENTVVEAERLRAELTAIRARGYALDDEEIERGLRCVAIPVFAEDGQLVAAVSVSGPTTRITLEAVPTLSRAVANAARSISASLGHRAVA